MALLEFDHVSLSFPIYNSRSLSFRNRLVSISTGGKLEKKSSEIAYVAALKDICFRLESGDRVGLIGHNGAGKSTLMRTMAGIYSPTQGKVIRQGSVATVFELGAGLDPELSGYDNIYRMGILLGLKHQQIKSQIRNIEEFTELGNFLQLPVRTYSSGMSMRLMFAMATSVQPNILLIDEMFGTGDAAFQEKASERMEQLMSSVDIVVFASHANDLIDKLCDKKIHLNHGTISEID